MVIHRHILAAAHIIKQKGEIVKVIFVLYFQCILQMLKKVPHLMASYAIILTNKTIRLLVIYIVTAITRWKKQKRKLRKICKLLVPKIGILFQRSSIFFIIAAQLRFIRLIICISQNRHKFLALLHIFTCVINRRKAFKRLFILPLIKEFKRSLYLHPFTFFEITQTMLHPALSCVKQRCHSGNQ